MPSLTTNPDGTPHVHEYVRALKPTTGKVDPKKFKCAHPDCTHFAYKYDLVGKRSICAVCHKAEIVLNYANLKLSNPRCFDCSDTKKARQMRQKKRMLEALFETPTVPPPAGV